MTSPARQRRPYVARFADTWLAEVLAELPAVMLQGPRGVGKTTTASRLCRSQLRLDRPEVAAALRSDPEVGLSIEDPPVLVDEWQLVPDTLAAAKRLIDESFAPGRFVFSGSVADAVTGPHWAATGRFVSAQLWGLTQREICGESAGSMFVDDLLDQPDDDLRWAGVGFSADLGDYVDLALKSGLPEAQSLSSDRARNAFLGSYIENLVTRDLALIADVRDPLKLATFLRVLAASTAGSPSTETLCRAGGLSRESVDRYFSLLSRLFVVEAVPAWSSNLLSRLAKRPKRYVCDAGLAAHLLGVDRRAVIRNADVSGRLFDTFAVSQLRPELVFGRQAGRAFHVQRGSELEVDYLVERADGSIAAFEFKAASSVSARDARHLVSFVEAVRAEPGQPRVRGVVMYAGRSCYRIERDVWAVPLEALWIRRR